MATVNINFNFSDGSSTTEDFDAECGVLGYIDDFVENTLESLNDDSDDEVELDDWEVCSTDTDYSEQKGPEDFNDLDDWGQYCENVDLHGEGYCLRYADIGDFDFDDEYQGCWSSEEEFAETYADDCMDIPDSMSSYFDCEKFARDLMMDYTSYEGDEGFHIFRDC